MSRRVTVLALCVCVCVCVCVLRSRSVCRSVCGFLCVCTHVFSRTVAAVDRYVDMRNGRSAQQESGVALSKNSVFTAGA